MDIFSEWTSLVVGTFCPAKPWTFCGPPDRRTWESRGDFGTGGQEYMGCLDLFCWRRKRKNQFSKKQLNKIQKTISTPTIPDVSPYFLKQIGRGGCYNCCIIRFQLPAPGGSTVATARTEDGLREQAVDPLDLGAVRLR